jgi:hypothetical protein
LRSLPVLVVETRGFVLVSAESRTVIAGFPDLPSSTSCHLRARSSPWRIPDLRATTISASSLVPLETAISREASSCERERTGRSPRVAAFFTRLAGLEGIRPSSTA